MSDLDEEALSRRRAANARWRSWSIEKNLNEALVDGEDSSGGGERMGGISRASPKAWEQFHQRFLDNLAQTQLRQLSQRRPSGTSPPLLPASAGSSGGGGGLAGAAAAAAAAAAGGGGSDAAAASEKSVRSGQIFGDMFRVARVTSLGDAQKGGSGLAAALSGFRPETTGMAAAAAAAVASLEGSGSEGPLLRRQPHVLPEIVEETSTGDSGVAAPANHGLGGSGGSGGGSGGSSSAGRTAAYFQQDYVDKMLRMHFTEFHNSNKFGGKNDNASAFLGDELSVHHNNVFGAYFGAGAGSRGVTPPDAPVPAYLLQGLTGRSPPGYGVSPPAFTPAFMPAFGGAPPPPPPQQQQRRPSVTEQGAAPPTPPQPRHMPPPAPRPATPARAPQQSAATVAAAAPAAVAGSPAAATTTRKAAVAEPEAAVLLPLRDTSCWSPNKRYWILPAVIASFPEALLQAALRESPRIPFEALGIVVGEGSEGSPAAIRKSLPEQPFRSIVLGSVSAVQEAEGGPLERWRPRWMVLRQNYLFEYATQDLERRPLGFANLHLAHVAPAALDPCVVRLEALMSPAETMKGERITVLLRAPSPAVRAVWLALLRRAAALEMSDLYELVLGGLGGGSSGSGGAPELDSAQPQRPHSPMLPGTELGRGRFTSVKRGRRKAKSSGGGSAATAPFASGSPEESRGGVQGPVVDTCALKIVDKSVFFDRVADGKERQDTLVREVLSQAVLTARSEELENCTIVRMYSIFETSERLVLEVELMSGVDLFDKLSTSGVLCDRDAAGLVRNVLQAVKFCLANGFAHRDVKLSNLIYPSGDHTQNPANVKLADFGMAGRVGSDRMLHGRCGTPGYVAPEILHAGVNEGYHTNVDTFSVGVVAYTVLCGYEPFYGVNERQLIAANKTAEYEFHDPEWASIPKDARDLVSKLLQKNPAKRLTPDEALQHPWILRHYPAPAKRQSPAPAPPAGCNVC